MDTSCIYFSIRLFQLGYTVAKLVPVDNRAISFGIFVVGVCPGGGASNIYSYLLDGDVSLSITMTLISTVAALGKYITGADPYFLERGCVQGV